MLVGLDDLDQLGCFEASFVLSVQLTSAARPAHLLAEELCQAFAVLGAHAWRLLGTLRVYKSRPVRMSSALR